ncbi:uncharacterized protein LOC144121135 [Amblyomma americanum]
MPLWRTRLALWIRENPYFAPLFLRLTLSLVLVLYLSLGASMFIVLASEDEDGKISTVSELRNRTSERLTARLQKLSSKPEAWSRTVLHHLAAYDDRMSGVDLRGCTETGNGPWSFSEAMLFSLALLTTSGGYDYAKTSSAVKATVMAYIFFGLPLVACWLLLHCKTVAQTWLLACVNIYRLATGLRKRFRTVSPAGAEDKDGDGIPAAPPRQTMTLFRPELSIVAGHLSYAQLALREGDRRIRVVSVGTPQGTTVVVNRQAVTAASAALCCCFLIYMLFGAGTMAAGSEKTMLDGLFWIFLQFTTTSSNSQAAFSLSPGARGGWTLYYAVGALQLTALAYMVFMLATWKCAFCEDTWMAQSTQA